MTRKQYRAIVQKLSEEYRSTNHSLGEVTLLRRLIPRIGEAISATGGNDVNGNRRFTIHQFVLDVTGDETLADLYWGQDKALDNPYTDEYFKRLLKKRQQGSGV